MVVCLVVVAAARRHGSRASLEDLQKDVKKMRDLAVVLGWQTTRVLCSTDLTRDEIRTFLTSSFALPATTFVVYFCGHGVRGHGESDGDGLPYPILATSERREPFYLRDLAYHYKNSPAGENRASLAIVADVCYSGKIADRSVVNHFFPDYDVTVQAACGAEEKAWEQEDGSGFFTAVWAVCQKALVDDRTTDRCTFHEATDATIATLREEYFTARKKIQATYVATQTWRAFKPKLSRQTAVAVFDHRTFSKMREEEAMGMLESHVGPKYNPLEYCLMKLFVSTPTGNCLYALYNFWLTCFLYKVWVNPEGIMTCEVVASRFSVRHVVAEWNKILATHGTRKKDVVTLP